MAANAITPVGDVAEVKRHRRGRVAVSGRQCLRCVGSYARGVAGWQACENNAASVNGGAVAGRSCWRISQRRRHAV